MPKLTGPYIQFKPRTPLSRNSSIIYGLGGQTPFTNWRPENLNSMAITHFGRAYHPTYQSFAPTLMEAIETSSDTPKGIVEGFQDLTASFSRPVVAPEISALGDLLSALNGVNEAEIDEETKKLLIDLAKGIFEPELRNSLIARTRKLPVITASSALQNALRTAEEPARLPDLGEEPHFRDK